MTKKREDRINKELFIKTLDFLIRRRNIALFRLNEIRRAGDPSAIQQAREIVRNIRLKFTREIDKHQHLLTDEEKRSFYRDNRRKKSE